MADSNADSDLKNSSNLIKNTDPDARSKIAAVFGGPPAQDTQADKNAKLEAMRRRMAQASGY